MGQKRLIIAKKLIKAVRCDVIEYNSKHFWKSNVWKNQPGKYEDICINKEKKNRCCLGDRTKKNFSRTIRQAVKAENYTNKPVEDIYHSYVTKKLTEI